MPLPRSEYRDDENKDGGEASHESRLVKRPRCSSCCNDTQDLFKEMQKLLQKQNKMLQKQSDRIESMCQENRTLREEVSCLKEVMSRFHGYLQRSPAPRMIYDQNFSIPLQLKFLNSCKNDKYSTRKIQADDETPLKIAICDHNNKIIEYEPFSSVRVQVVPIHSDFDNDHEGQWTKEYFRSKIVTGRPGKEHLLSGDLYLRLQDGVGYLNSARFQDNSSFVASKRFKLGVMASDHRISQRIQEGITESFAVKDVRGYSSKKNVYPSPHDAVHKLIRIAPNGDRHKSLEQKGIKTVEDFLCFLRKSPEDLRKIMGKISDKDWEAIINHARKCNEGKVSREHEAFSRSDDSYCLQGSCSVQPSSAPQNIRITQLLVPQNRAEPFDFHVTQQQISWTNDELSPRAALENVPCILEGIQTASDEQVIGVGNVFLSTMDNSSQQQHRSSDCSTMLDGNVLTHVNPPVNNDIEELPLDDCCGFFGKETELMREDLLSWMAFFSLSSGF